MKPHCKLWFLANSLPRFKNGTEAELRRTRFLRFESKPAKPDVTLKQRVGMEAEGVFILMVQHLQMLLTLDRIPVGGAHSQAVHTRFQVSNDPLGTFIRRHCTLSPTEEVLKTALATSFKSYCELHSLPTKINDAFFKQLYEREPNVTDDRVTKDGQRVHLVKGISLKPDAPKEVLEHVEPFC
jgi:phage/plasmid-associated DNA primase